MSLEIDTHLFYTIGIWAFGIVAIMNLATLLQTFQGMLATEIISALGNILFNFALFGFFVYLRKNLPPKEMKPATDEEMEEFLKG